MIVTEEPRQVTTDLLEAHGVNSEALIKEARRRQRKRWLAIGVVVLIVAVASGIWAVSNGRSATKQPSSSKPVQVKTAGLAGAPGSRHTNPLQLVGTWRVIASSTHPSPIVSLSSIGLLVWTSCGWMDGEWNANHQGLFVGSLSGGPSACLLGPRSASNLNPKWLAAAGYTRAGHDELLLDVSGRVLARLVPTTVPKALTKGVDPAYAHPVVTPQLRAVMLRVNSPLPSGLVPASRRQITGRWVAITSAVWHWQPSPYLSFNADGSWTGSDGCNRLGSRWSIGSHGVLVTILSVQTLIGCHNVNVGDWLNQATRVAFQGRTLVLVNAAGKVTGRLGRG
jgi:hypothetical protein